MKAKPMELVIDNKPDKLSRNIYNVLRCIFDEPY